MRILNMGTKPPIKYQVVLTGRVVEAATQTELIAKLEPMGFRHVGESNWHSQNHIALKHQPAFKNLCGPMYDGGRIRYEDWETYDICSR